MLGSRPGPRAPCSFPSRARLTSCPSFAPVEVPKMKKEKLPKEKKPKVKNDPAVVTAARELNARYLEKINENPMVLESAGKYDLVRGIESSSPRIVPLLDAA